MQRPELTQELQEIQNTHTEQFLKMYEDGIISETAVRDNHTFMMLVKEGGYTDHALPALTVGNLKHGQKVTIKGSEKEKVPAGEYFILFPHTFYGVEGQTMNATFLSRVSDGRPFIASEISLEVE